MLAKMSDLDVKSKSAIFIRLHANSHKILIGNWNSLPKHNI